MRKQARGPMTAAEFNRIAERAGLSRTDLQALLGKSPRQIDRYRQDGGPIPLLVAEYMRRLDPGPARKRRAAA